MLIGIDLGGTKFHIGLVDSQYKITGSTQRYSSQKCQSADELLKKMADGVRETLDVNGLSLTDIEGIGIGSPGPLDPYVGEILNTLNLTVFRNFPLKKRMETELGVPVFVDNDANCFALGEQRGGEAKGRKHVMAITLGTGYGFALVINGELLHGATGTATEIAKTPYLDSEYEEYISGRGLQMIHKKRTGKDVKPEKISLNAFEGDEACQKTFAEFGYHLAMTLIPMVNTFDPGILVIGGSIAANWDYFYTSLDQTIRPLLFDRPRKNLKIVRSSLGEFATIIGAASLVKMEFSI